MALTHQISDSLGCASMGCLFAFALHELQSRLESHPCLQKFGQLFGKGLKVLSREFNGSRGRCCIRCGFGSVFRRGVHLHATFGLRYLEGLKPS